MRNNKEFNDINKYYKSQSTRLSDKPKLSYKEVSRLSDSIVNNLIKENEVINMEDSWSIIFNTIMNKYGDGRE